MLSHDLKAPASASQIRWSIYIFSAKRVPELGPLRRPDRGVRADRAGRSTECTCRERHRWSGARCSEFPSVSEFCGCRLSTGLRPAFVTSYPLTFVGLCWPGLLGVEAPRLPLGVSIMATVHGAPAEAWLSAKVAKLKAIQPAADPLFRPRGQHASAAAASPADFIGRTLKRLSEEHRKNECQVARVRASISSESSNATLLARLPLVSYADDEPHGVLSESERMALRHRLAVLKRLQRPQAAQREEQQMANEQPADAAAILFSTLLYESMAPRPRSSDRLVDVLSEEERRAAGLLAREGVAGSALMACSIADMAELLASCREACESARDALGLHDSNRVDDEAPTTGAAAMAEGALAGSVAALSHARRLGLA